MFTPHPTMSSDEIRERTQGVWDSFYNLSSIAGSAPIASNRR